jgi:hypothetical protein
VEGTGVSPARACDFLSIILLCSRFLLLVI